jgi:hypothetical protein
MVAGVKKLGAMKWHVVARKEERQQSACADGDGANCVYVCSCLHRTRRRRIGCGVWR